jgi:hypothetical protein
MGITLSGWWTTDGCVRSTTGFRSIKPPSPSSVPSEWRSPPWVSVSRPSAGWIVGFVALLIIFAALPSLAARVNRLQQGRAAAERCMKRLLDACGHSFGYPGIHVRVNLMKYSPDRRRRKVEGATAFNMSSDPDVDLELDATAGVSGQASIHRRPAFGDISIPLKPGGPDWGLTDSQKARVRRSLKSILSVPVFNSADPDGPLLATLQVDSDLPLEESGLETEEKWLMAERFADVVSLLLEAAR